MIGRHVGPFTVLGHLGEGRMGKVHLAKHEVLNTWRAVRRSSPQRTRPLIVHVVPESARGSRYQLGDKLGTGGMAEVHAGTMIGAEGFARRVAIKRVRPSLAEI